MIMIMMMKKGTSMLSLKCTTSYKCTWGTWVNQSLVIYLEVAEFIAEYRQDEEYMSIL